MRRVLWVSFIVLLATRYTTGALGLGSVSIGIHLTPAIDRVEGRRAWDLSLSLSGVAVLGTSDSVECTVVVDSGPTTLGTIAEYRHDATSRFSAGVGVAILWPFSQDERLLAPIIESFAHAAVHGVIVDPLSGELSFSFPAVTIANPGDGWKLVPFSGLPALSASVIVAPISSAGFEAHLTLQPVLVDTTVFTDPIGRLTDDLLLLPTVSGYLHYFP
ncbi:MAG: hypothetical protein PHU43_04765 [Candidatus Bipolaricaulis sp.]|nr:hypothetical protein [Candidatus Bipolaricaulis sp.]